MPPRRRRRRKVVRDEEEEGEEEEEEVVPAKKRRQKTETVVMDSSAEKKQRSSGSRTRTGSVVSLTKLSPAKKLRKKLNLKEDLDTAEEKEKEKEEEDKEKEEEEEEEEEGVESKYFHSNDKVTATHKSRETKKSQSELAAKKVESGRGESNVGGKRSVENQRVGQKKRKGAKAASKSGSEKELKEEEEEENVSKKKPRRRRVSVMSQSKADEMDVNEQISPAEESTVVRAKKKSASGGGGGRSKGKRGRRGGKREHEMEEEEPLADPSASSESESEWEEVEELPPVDADEPWKSQLPDKPVQITFDASELVKKKRKKGGFDVKEYFRLQLNRFRTETQRNAHKVHLLCLLSHGRFRNSVCCSVTLQSIALSLVPPEFTDGDRSAEKWTLHRLTMFTRWFKKTIPIDDSATADINEEVLSDRLVARFSQRSALTEDEFILMFVISCRSIGLFTRLVYSFQPIAFKATDLKKNKTEKNLSAPAQKKTTEKSRNEATNDPKKSKRKRDSTTTDVELNRSENEKLIIRSSPASASMRGGRDSLVDEGGIRSKESQPSEKMKQRSNASSKTDEETFLHPPQTKDNMTKTKNHRPRRSGSKVNYDTGERDKDSEDEDDDWKEEAEESNTGSDSDGRDSGKRRKRSNSSEDDDFEEDAKVVFRRPTSIAKKRTNRQKQRMKRRQQQQRSEEVSVADTKTSDDKGCDWWTEIYLDDEEKWICVNGSQLQVNRPESVEQLATKPLSYILAFDNGDGVKDVTKKYASEWMSSVKKIRVDESWWKDVLAPFQVEECERDVKEEAHVREQLLKKPMPTTISDFKDHSLYALRRHLLKYEAIYPPDAPVLGHIRGEPVYPRDCVHCLHAREKWRIEGRLVRVDEEPYKIVKARPKWNKPKEFNDRLKLLLFGRWQTEEFIPLPALDGKIPKNEYGNVEVFKPWMIPAGTIYLSETMNGLGRVARKLDLDVAPAMVGWDFHGGFNHPILQGWIICEEHRETLVAAWEEDQAIQQQKEAEKKQQRILGNWKLLIKGLLIRERLKKRYDLQEPTVSKRHQVADLDTDEGQEENDADSAQRKKEEEDESWPENLKKKKKMEKEKKGDSGRRAENLFPFEKDHQRSSSDQL